MAPPVDLPPVHDDLDFLAPMSSSRADELGDFLATGRPALVADAGCGWGELLLRTLERSDESSGVGVDLDEHALAHGRAQAHERGLSERTDFRAGAVVDLLPGAADAMISIGASHAWRADTGTVEPTAYTPALVGVRGRLGAGARCVYGEGIWSTSPTPGAIAALGGREDEFVRLEELAERIETAGFEIVRLTEANLDEWDAFESGFVAGYVRWLEANDHRHPDADHVAARLHEQRTRYHEGYRGVMGMAYAELIAV